MPIVDWVETIAPLGLTEISRIAWSSEASQLWGGRGKDVSLIKEKQVDSGVDTENQENYSVNSGGGGGLEVPNRRATCAVALFLCSSLM